MVATGAEPFQTFLPAFPKTHYASHRRLIVVLASLGNYPKLISNLNKIVFIWVEPLWFEWFCVNLEDNHPCRSSRIGKEEWVGVRQVHHLGMAWKSLPH